MQPILITIKDLKRKNARKVFVGKIADALLFHFSSVAIFNLTAIKEKKLSDLYTTL